LNFAIPAPSLPPKSRVGIAQGDAPQIERALLIQASEDGERILKLSRMGRCEMNLQLGVSPPTFVIKSNRVRVGSSCASGDQCVRSAARQQQR
jgi:hypothetical protein